MAATLRMRGGRKTNYPYAVARVQAKRAKLIPGSEYEKILKMDVSEITRYIQDSEYKAEVDELAARFSGLDLLEAAITVNEERIFHSVRRMLGGEGGALVELFLARHLVSGLKSVLRGKNAGASRDELLKELLLEDLDTYNIFHPLLADDVRTPQDMAATLERQGGVGRDMARVMHKVPADAGLSAYEDALDKAYYSRLVESLQASGQKGSEEFLQFARREIDARNILNAARWVASGQAGDFSPYVIPGGRYLGVAEVMALSRADSMDAFADGLKATPFHDPLREALQEAGRTGRMAPFRSAVQRVLDGELRKLTHVHPLSILPILLFLVHKDREAITLRALARGKAAGLSEERLRELIQ